MKKQKIIKIGNSAGITIPREIREEAGFKLGDAVAITYNGENISVSPLIKKAPKGVTPRFAKIVEDFISEHEDVLKELAKK